MEYTKTEQALHYEQGTALSESGSNDESSSCDQRWSSFANELGLTELHKDDKAYELIYRRCCQSPQLQIVSILKNTFQSPLGQAKLKAFHLFTDSVAKKNGGSKTAAEAARVKYCWCGVEKEELKTIIMYGFRSNYGFFLHVLPDNAPLQCVTAVDFSSSSDEDGIRYLLLSRVILGKSEVVAPRGSTTQLCPSSPEFDSGVDSLTSPKKYTIWSTHMNTHVLPEFVVCIKTPSILTTKSPKSPWILFPVLIKLMSKFLNPSQIRLIQKHYTEKQNRRISRSEFIQRLRSIIGDRLLVHIIKSSGQKVPEGSKPINLEPLRS